MTGYPRQFDELFVVSDIHMGGEPGFQIFNRGKRLAAFIQQVAAQRHRGSVALVLNGDIIDSLAETDVGGYVALDGDTAVRMMRRIADDPAFKPVWDALATYVQTDGRHLVIVVGNHDIELALPIVEDWIRARLAPNDPLGQARITFATHGGGFACRVGTARVFCTHGNEVDEWNLVDYTLLGQLANAINAGRVADRDKWQPNAGTRLVKDVMNVVKQVHPFVDLLKPETAAVAAVLVAVDWDTFKKVDLSAAFPVLRDKVKGKLITRRLLSADAVSLAGVEPRVVADEMTEQLLGPRLREAVQESRRETPITVEDSLLLEAGRRMAAGTRPSQLVGPSATLQTLGFSDLIYGWVGRLDKEEGLRLALEDWLSKDTTFDPGSSEGDGTYEAIRARVADTVDVVVTGHTHLARALSLGGRRRYFNCGTWIRLLRLSTESLAKEVFRSKVWPRLKEAAVAELDDCTIPGPKGQEVSLLFDRTNATHVWSDDEGGGKKVMGELLRIGGVEDGTPLRVELEPGTIRHEVRS